MPPKAAPARGGTRGRGRGRGGAAAGRAAAAAPPAGESADVKPPVAQMVDPTSSTEGAAEGTTAEAAPAARTRKPVQRLESLSSAEPGSSSAAPKRTASTRGKKPAIVKPTFTGRRSKEERSQLAKDVSKREAQRLADAEKAEKQRQRLQNKGPRKDQKDQAGVVVGGPFSGGSVARDKRAVNRITSMGGRATRIKSEYGEGGGSGGRGGGGGGGGGGGRGGEDGGYISSGDDEDGDTVPRKDIDAIELSSDEEEAPAAGRASKPRSTQEILLPVRIGRKEHEEKSLSINTEASSEDAAKILQQAEATGGAIKAEPSLLGKKGKPKGKEVEITGLGRPYKGMWQDSDDSDSLFVKTEPTSEDEAMADAVPLPNSEAEPTVISSADGTPAPVADMMGIKTEPPKRRRAKGKNAEPVLQTAEEKAEYARSLEFAEAVRKELGPENDAPGEPRDEASYIFQLPPRMPTAKMPNIVKKDEDTEPLPGTAPKPKAQANRGVQRKRKEMKVPAGLVGKLRVHESGRVSLRWGNETFELVPGNVPGFQQEVVDVENVPEHLRVVPNEGGEGTSFGAVKGTFVGMPNWKAMLR